MIFLVLGTSLLLLLPNGVFALAQDIAGSSEPTPENVLIVRPGYEDHLLLSEDGAGVSRYTPNIEPAGDLREPETVAAIMGDRYIEDMI